MRQASIDNFKYLSNFNSLKQFNNAIEMFLSSYKSDFTQSELLLFKRLSKFGAKTYGVANCSIRTLLKAVEEKSGKKISESTFHRMKRKAIKLGILSVKTTTRKNKSQSANLWIFNKFINNDTPKHESKGLEHALDQQSDDKGNDTPSEADKHSKTSNILNTRRKHERQHQDYTYIPSNVPESFVDVVKNYFNDASKIFKLYGKALLAHKISKVDKPLESMTDTIIKAFKESVFAFKQYRIKKEFTGYYFGTLRGLFAVEKRKEVNHSSLQQFEDMLEDDFWFSYD